MQLVYKSNDLPFTTNGGRGILLLAVPCVFRYKLDMFSLLSHNRDLIIFNQSYV